ncbi:PucR family transcriptional regulator [Nocardia sp. NPDC127579]|uniref:PucR family transcriptional regulator n=1 Tax=Nocardia sp. NPDC127579 TaxID=3345402 RepID=UPI0036390B6D
MSGENAEIVARTAGIPIAESYSVLGVAFPGTPKPANPTEHESMSVRGRPGRVTAVLRELAGPDILPLLGLGGGTVLIPEAPAREAIPAELLDRMTRAAGVPVTATVVSTTPAQIAASTDLAHELLHIVQRLGYQPKLYRFADLAFEYQVTRPGPVLNYLLALLQPVHQHPDLLNTLRHYVSSDWHRQITARALSVHTNTVDYRLRRIKEITGLDPYRPADLWCLHSAVIADAYGSAHTD